MNLTFGPRRGVYIDVTKELKTTGNPLTAKQEESFTRFDQIYRSLCALMYNYVPLSGHPGGSISSGRFVASIMFDSVDYDHSDPLRDDADMISYAAGHKAMGLYGLWALRNEVVRIGAPDLLAKKTSHQLRLEDLLGFRRNPVADTPLFKKFKSKALDGHPTPTTPFVKLSTGASGVGVTSSMGLAFGAKDYYGDDAPMLHMVEGEGGMTPGRVSEAMASAGTSALSNVIMHIDWNQASIDSNAVCRDGIEPGDYVQWTPLEFSYLHDWNVIWVPDGTNLQQVVAAQRKALDMGNNQPTAIVYKTTKGWQYGIEGKASHGAGHKLCSEDFYKAAGPLVEMSGMDIPCNDEDCEKCASGANAEQIEKCYWKSLEIVRAALEKSDDMIAELSGRLVASRDRLNKRARKPRAGAPDVEKIFAAAAKGIDNVPDELKLEAGQKTTLRGELGKCLSYYNKQSGGAILAAAADLLGSTSISKSADGFPPGFYKADTNPGSRILSVGGICEDAISGVLSGVAGFGRHVGAGSSYGAFIAALGHISSRLHAIGNQARNEVEPGPNRPFFLICAHAGVKTGEDGPTHADPQPLQLFQENFPRGAAITLTPWDPAEMWPLVTTALNIRPSVIAPFVTRPDEKIPDRKALGMAPASAARTGVYHLKKANGKGDGTIVLQGSEVGFAFAEETMPLLEKEGIDLNVYYVASAEIFDTLTEAEKASIFPEKLAMEAMGITGFTLPTMYRWICSERGRAHSLYPFRGGHFLGSGKAHMVMKEAGLNGEAQFKAIARFVKER
jgi:transketolase